VTTLPFGSESERRAAASQVEIHLRSGGLLAYPTETVYGLGSRARFEDLMALAQLKGRDPAKPFLLLVSSRAMAADHDLRFSREADALAHAFWPGPLTLILPGGSKLPDLLRGPEGGIAVRWTSHQGMAGLIEYLHEPITSTSANRPGGRTAPGVGAIVEAFAEAVSGGELLVLDGGVLGNVPPSTLVDCTGDVPRLVRDGAIPRDELTACVGGLAS